MDVKINKKNISKPAVVSIITLIAVIVVIGSFFSSQLVKAQTSTTNYVGDSRSGPGFEEGLVPCGLKEFTISGEEKPDCSVCHFFVLLNNLVRFVLIMSFLAGGILLVGAGILILLGGFYEPLRQIGKKTALGVAGGLAIMVLSWLLVSTVIVILAQGNENVTARFNLSLDPGQVGFLIECEARAPAS